MIGMLLKTVVAGVVVVVAKHTVEYFESKLDDLDGDNLVVVIFKKVLKPMKTILAIAESAIVDTLTHMTTFLAGMINVGMSVIVGLLSLFK